MKGMQKIKRGNNFKGVLEYAFDRDKNEEKTPGHIVGGNMAGTNTRELTREFLRFADFRPDVEKPVWHNSLRLPKGEHLTDDEWNNIGFDYVGRIGFDPNFNQFVFIKHDDEEGEHIHIIGNRIDMQGNLYLGKNENVISTRVISELEHDHHLTITKNLDYIQDDQGNYQIAERSQGRGRTLSRAEEDMQNRKQWNDANYIAPKQRLADAIQFTLKNQPTTEEFVKGLEAENIKVMCVIKQGQMVGFSFGIDGENFKGSQVGANWKELTNERKLNYEQERDTPIITSRRYVASKPAASNNATDPNASKKPARKSTKEPRKPRDKSFVGNLERDSRGHFTSVREPANSMGFDQGQTGQSSEPNQPGTTTAPVETQEVQLDDAGRWGIADIPSIHNNLSELQTGPRPSRSNETASDSRESKPISVPINEPAQTLTFYVHDLDEPLKFRRALNIEGLEEPELTIRWGLLTDLKKANCGPWEDPALAQVHIHGTNIMAFKTNAEFVELRKAMDENRSHIKPDNEEEIDYAGDLQKAHALWNLPSPEYGNDR